METSLKSCFSSYLLQRNMTFALHLKTIALVNNVYSRYAYKYGILEN